MTSNQICYAEAGYPSLPDFIRYKFFHKMWLERLTMLDDPLSFTITVTMQTNTRTGKFIKELLEDKIPNMSSLIGKVNSVITASSSSWCLAYKEFYPYFKVHDIYTRKESPNLSQAFVHVDTVSQLRLVDGAGPWSPPC